MTLSIPSLALLASLAGALSCGGLVVAYRGWRPPPPRIGPRRRSPVRAAVGWVGGADTSARDRAARQLHMALAAVLAAAVWLITSTPAMGLIAAVAALGLPRVLTVGGGSKARIAKLDAMGSWIRSLATRISAGAGLEQALGDSLQDARDPIAAEVRTLSAQLQAGLPVEAALQEFADGLADDIGDFLSIALMLSAITRGSGLRESLERLAGSVDKLVADRRVIEAERTRPRVTARLVTLISVGAFAAMQANGAFMAPYRSPVGQLVLLGIATAFGGCLVWMAALTKGKPGPRMLGEQSSIAPSLENFGRQT